MSAIIPHYRMIMSAIAFNETCKVYGNVIIFTYNLPINVEVYTHVEQRHNDALQVTKVTKNRDLTLTLTTCTTEL